MSGLVTLLWERLETIARLWAAGSLAWAYTSCEQANDHGRWIYTGADVSRISRINEWSSFLCSDLQLLTETWHLCSPISHSTPPFLSTTIYRPPNPTPPPSSFFSPISVRITEALPVLIIVGGAVGGGCVLLICVITLVSLCCRHTGKGELNG